MHIYLYEVSDCSLHLIYSKFPPMLVNSTTSTIRLDKAHPKVLKLCPTAHDNYLMIVTTDLFD